MIEWLRRRPRDWHAQAAAFIDAELSPRESERFRAHLAACADCRRDVAEFRTTKSLLASLPQPVPRRTLTLNAEQALSPRRGAASWSTPVRGGLVARAATAFSVAAAAALGAAILADVTTDPGADAPVVGLETAFVTQAPVTEAARAATPTSMEPTAEAATAAAPESPAEVAVEEEKGAVAALPTQADSPAASPEPAPAAPSAEPAESAEADSGPPGEDATSAEAAPTAEPSPAVPARADDGSSDEPRGITSPAREPDDPDPEPAAALDESTTEEAAPVESAPLPAAAGTAAEAGRGGRDGSASARRRAGPACARCRGRRAREPAGHNAAERGPGACPKPRPPPYNPRAHRAATGSWRWRSRLGARWASGWPLPSGFAAARRDQEKKRGGDAASSYTAMALDPAAAPRGGAGGRRLYHCRTGSRRREDALGDR